MRKKQWSDSQIQGMKWWRAVVSEKDKTPAKISEEMGMERERRRAIEDLQARRRQEEELAEVWDE